MRLGKKKTEPEQDAKQEQKETSKRTDKQEQESNQEEDTGTEQGSDEEEGQAEQTGEAKDSLKQVLEILKQADLINTDASLKSLVKEGKLVPPREWGILMASGHWLLIWRRKGL